MRAKLRWDVVAAWAEAQAEIHTQIAQAGGAQARQRRRQARLWRSLAIRLRATRPAAATATGLAVARAVADCYALRDLRGTNGA